MTTLGGILATMIIAILVGKRAGPNRLTSYIMAFFLALAAVAVVLVRMYTISELAP
jgi:hypothetical protein